MKYLVLSPGRTGSTMLSRIIAVGYNLPQIHRFESKTPITELKDIVIHSHVHYFSETGTDIQVEDVTLVISKRRCMFDSIMNWFIAEQTKELTEYTTILDPFEIDKTKFRDVYSQYLWYYNHINLSLPYKDIVVVYHDDILELGVQVVEEKLKIPFIQIPVISTQKNINHYKDVISNYKEMYDIYLRFEKTNRTYGYNLSNRNKEITLIANHFLQQ